jgi:hypothetical protein
MAAELEAGVGIEHGFEVGPVGFVHLVEGKEIDGDGFVREFSEETFHGGAEFFVVHRGREVIHDAVFVGDAEGIEPLHEHGILLFDEPDADEAGGGVFEGGAGKGGDDGGVALNAGLAFEKDGADLADFSDGVKGGAVKGLVGFKSEREDFAGEGGRHETDKFVRREHNFYTGNSVNDLEIEDITSLKRQ